MNKFDMRKQKRRDVVEAIVNRPESIQEVARIFNVPHRTILDWLVWFRTDGWDRLYEKMCCGRPLTVAQDPGGLRVHDPREPTTVPGRILPVDLEDSARPGRQPAKVQVSTSSLSRLLRKAGLSPQRAVSGLPQRVGAGKGLSDRHFPVGVGEGPTVERPDVLC